MYNFQCNDDIIPIFYITKEVWNDELKKIIHESLQYRMCYLLVKPDNNVCNRYAEFTIMCRKDFYNFYEQIDHLLGIDIEPLKINKINGVWYVEQNNGEINIL